MLYPTLSFEVLGYSNRKMTVLVPAVCHDLRPSFPVPEALTRVSSAGQRAGDARTRGT